MRQFKLSKKLRLNKNTVANLKEDKMADVLGKGLESVPYSACPSICAISICPCPTNMSFGEPCCIG